MKVLVIGDIVGRTGRQLVQKLLPELKEKYRPALVIANGENAAGGAGITPVIARELFGYGIDVITSGNHIWDKKEIIPYFSLEERLIRPENYPPGTPGRGWVIVRDSSGIPVAVTNFAGRTFMDNLECPFRSADALLSLLQEQTRIILVDFHGEATSEKQAFGWYLNGRVTAVFGTHTHVQTADERILNKGTAYITDIGMTGPTEGIIGVERETVIMRFLTQMPQHFHPAKGPGELNGIVLEIDEVTGTSLGIKRISESD
ncbi:MAG: TIGR00282 family metallophosphoesterase [bacterium]|jgi:metallophosphoesterase (TIGR00282 family)